METMDRINHKIGNIDQTYFKYTFIDYMYEFSTT